MHVLGIEVIEVAFAQLAAEPNHLPFIVAHLGHKVMVVHVPGLRPRRSTRDATDVLGTKPSLVARQSRAC
jgi:hypothetical protein